jgi:2',3'-cyclic-nucleotide 2'-phosphodiesterase (5'-nucleotidase family)
LADAVFEQANIRSSEYGFESADLLILNRGGIRTNIAKGPITLRNMFEIMPFENTLLVVTLSPEKMKEMLEYMRVSGGHPISNMKLEIVNNQFKNITIAGEKYDPSKDYKVVTTDYLQHGGDRMNFFLNPVKIDSLNYLMRDAMIDYFTIHDTVSAKFDNRFSYGNE